MPYADISQPPAPLPSPSPRALWPGATLQTPLTRDPERRRGAPGLVVLSPEYPSAVSSDGDRAVAIRDGVPAPLLKWAEEGYCVVELRPAALLDGASSAAGVEGAGGKKGALERAVAALRDSDACAAGGQKMGLVCYAPGMWNAVMKKDKAPVPEEIAAAVCYVDGGGGEEGRDSLALGGDKTPPTLLHVAGMQGPNPKRSQAGRLVEYHYPGAVDSHLFATPFGAAFHYNTEAVSHTRSLSFLKPRMGGPYFDLETIWDEHTYYEFADRSVEHTMSTMVAEPYVNHVPTMTGGIGRMKLSQFYRDNFIFNNSDDTDLELLSRTIGIDRIVDEFIFKFTHDKPLDWLLPGVPPTNLYVEVPFTGIVNIRGDRLYHEHIAWDQGTVLRQLGLMPEYLPYPYPVAGLEASQKEGKKVEYRVPVGGVEIAGKLRERNSVPSNDMFRFEPRVVPE